MTCDEALEALLEADRGALERGADPDTPLGRHLARCARCRRAAALIVRGTSSLEAWLEAAPAELDVESVLTRAERAPTPKSGPPAEAWPAPGRTVVRWGLPLAAAAALATVLLVRDPGAPPLPDARPADAERETQGLALDVPEGRHAAVIHTTDPDITVVWFYGGD